MRQAFLLSLVTLVIFSCNKDEKKGTQRCDTYLIITSTNSSRTTTLATGIKTVINCYGPDLCYCFSKFEINLGTGNIYEIHAKGTVPCSPSICADAIYAVKDSIMINPSQAGTYYLKFFNNTSLYKTDTVTVN